MGSVKFLKKSSIESHFVFETRHFKSVPIGCVHRDIMNSSLTENLSMAGGFIIGEICCHNLKIIFK